jgi:hypothetical protein
MRCAWPPAEWLVTALGLGWERARDEAGTPPSRTGQVNPGSKTILVGAFCSFWITHSFGASYWHVQVGYHPLGVEHAQ